MKQINQALQQKLAEFKEKSGMSQTQLARGIDTSPASVSMYLNGTYAEKGGNYETIEPKIEAFLEMQDSKAKREELVLGFVSTKTTRRIVEVMRAAHEGGEYSGDLRSGGIGQDSGGQKLLREKPCGHLD
ncbi:phage transposase [Neisseria meningitidis]|nr:phage transposase [Neisseria meningitidis]CKK01606.1 phage transposase [Neisseria meningitidis]CKK05505.1 phage transposase [Neisseria meningitidis]